MTEKHAEQKRDVLLIAEVKAYLLDGETVELLPFKHEKDVRAEVNTFIEDWSKTGFLMKDGTCYPWHRVKSVEITSVNAMTHAEAAPYLQAWRQDTERQKRFWKTVEPQAKEEKDEGGGSGNAH